MVKIQKQILSLFPRWMQYHAFFSNKYRSYPFLRLINDYIHLNPKLKVDKIFYYLKCKYKKYPLIGHIHVPKTGGSYTTTLQKSLPHINFSHVVIRNDFSDKYCPVGLRCAKPESIKNFFIFSNVRNPLNFFVSYYHHVLGFGQHTNVNHYDYKNASKGFDYLINAILNRDDKWPSRKFLFPQLFDQEGKLIVDWINRAEYLDDDLKKLCEYFGYSYNPKQKVRVAPKEKSYKDYYNNSLKNRVLDHYNREIEMFGYSLSDGHDIIKIFQPTDKSNIKYFYTKDLLIIE